MPLEGTTFAMFAGKANVIGKQAVRIDIVGLGPGGPAFSPTFLVGSPGQKLKVTVFQTSDLSANFQHNFSVPSLGIDQDIPKGAGHSITLTVTIPDSGAVVFFCKYHLDEAHAGAFIAAS